MSKSENDNETRRSSHVSKGTRHQLECSKCDFRTMYKSHMNRHELTHTSLRPCHDGKPVYKCEHCEYPQFSQTASKDTPPPTRENGHINVTNVTSQQEQDQHYRTTWELTQRSVPMSAPSVTILQNRYETYILTSRPILESALLSVTGVIMQPQGKRPYKNTWRHILENVRTDVIRDQNDQ